MGVSPGPSTTFTGVAVHNNGAVGGRGSDGCYGLATAAGNGGNAAGAGIALSLANLSGDVSMTANQAWAGDGGNGADAFCASGPADGVPGGVGGDAGGGAIENRGSFTSSSSDIQFNEVRVGAGGLGGAGCGGGAPGADGSSGGAYGGGINSELGSLNIAGSVVANNTPTDLNP